MWDQVMAWCLMAPRHYSIQFWSRSMLMYVIHKVLIMFFVGEKLSWIVYRYLSIWRNSDQIWWFVKISLFISSPLSNRSQLNFARWIGWLNLSPLGQYGRHFSDDIFRYILVNEKFCIFIKISLNVVPRDPIDNHPTLVQIMAWYWIGNKPLS